MKLYFTQLLDFDRWGARMYAISMSDCHVPLWKKAGIYDILYGKERLTCREAVPELTRALTEMCVLYLDYRKIVKFPPIGDDDPGSFMDELLREQGLRQATAVLAMLIQAANLYPRAIICRKKEEAILDG